MSLWSNNCLATGKFKYLIVLWSNYSNFNKDRDCLKCWQNKWMKKYKVLIKNACKDMVNWSQLCPVLNPFWRVRKIFWLVRSSRYLLSWRIHKKVVMRSFLRLYILMIIIKQIWTFWMLPREASFLTHSTKVWVISRMIITKLLKTQVTQPKLLHLISQWSQF